MLKTVLETQKKGSFVSSDHVNSLVKTYKLQRWKDNSEKIGKSDSLSTWFGLDELQSFLYQAKQNNADGIKMYFGVYPSDYNNEVLAGRQTLVLVATRKSAAHSNAPNKAIFVNREGKKEILAFNMGEACPPYCGGIPPDYDKDLTMEMDNIGTIFIEKDGNMELI